MGWSAKKKFSSLMITNIMFSVLFMSNLFVCFQESSLPFPSNHTGSAWLCNSTESSCRFRWCIIYKTEKI